MTSSLNGYRRDIDGLRAIAVLSVFAFHIAPGRLPGGFVGVDIFFVISGFLISNNIISDLETERFSFLAFYERRVRRIFPALALILIFVYIIGLLALSRGDNVFNLATISSTDQLSKSIVAGAGFFSNFILWRDTNYFNESPLTQPLLHLWSLAIEEQFYIVWPFALYIAFKFKQSFLMLTLSIGTASFVANILTATTDPVAAFYSPLSRFWELMLGAALFCLQDRSKFRDFLNISRFSGLNNAKSAMGVIFIGLGVCITTEKSTFPGWIALLPTVGSALYISAGGDAWLNKNLLGNKVFVWIGLISYPLYLWHWPSLLIFQKFVVPNIHDHDGLRLATVGLIAVVLMLSWLTFVIIEIPVRFGTYKRLLGVAAVLLMILIACCAGITPTAIAYFDPRLSPYQEKALAALVRVTGLKDLKKMYGERPCFKYEIEQTYQMFIDHKCLDVKFPGNKTIFLIGDSHSASLSLGIRPLLERFNTNILQVSTGYCEPTANLDSVCKDINEMVLHRISETKPDLVIMDANWVGAAQPPFFSGSGDYYSVLLKKIYDIKQRGAKNILIVGQIPLWFPSLPVQLSDRYIRNNQPIPERTFLGVDTESLKIDASMRALSYPKNVTYLSVKDALCDKSGCLTKVGPNLEKDIIVWDYGHLTIAGAKFLTHALIEPELSKIFEHPLNLNN